MRSSLRQSLYYTSNDGVRKICRLCRDFEKGRGAGPPTAVMAHPVPQNQQPTHPVPKDLKCENITCKKECRATGNYMQRMRGSFARWVCFHVTNMRRNIKDTGMLGRTAWLVLI